MSRAENTAICIDTTQLVGKKGDMLLLNPGPLHTLVAEIREATDHGAPFITPRDNIVRSSQVLTKEIPGWLRSMGDFRREGYPDARIQWFGVQEQNGISSFSFVMGHGEHPDIMEIASMDSSGEYKKPITYLRRVPCTEPNEVVSVSTRYRPSETQLRSLAELSIISGVPHVVAEMLSDLGRRTLFNAVRSMSAENSEDGIPVIWLTSPEIALFTPYARQTS